MQRESKDLALKRWDTLELIQNEYKDFRTFLVDVQREVYGWVTTPMQLDIAKYLQHGGKRIAIHAQRGKMLATSTSDSSLLTV